MSRVDRVIREKKGVEIRTEVVGKVKREEGGQDIEEEKKELCQNYALGSNLQRQARPPAFTLNHDR